MKRCLTHHTMLLAVYEASESAAPSLRPTSLEIFHHTGVAEYRWGWLVGFLILVTELWARPPSTPTQCSQPVFKSSTLSVNGVQVPTDFAGLRGQPAAGQRETPGPRPVDECYVQGKGLD